MSALQPAHSHWIESHGYSNGVMTLITKSGEAYAATIPESRYTDFLKAPSQGAFFNLYIKPFATVTKVDVPALVAAAVATPSTVAVPRKARKAPAKSLLPHRPAPAGATDAWIDFRCIGDPTTGPGLVKALKRFLENKDKRFDYYIPYMGYDAPPGEVGIAALQDWGTGKVDRKYLKAFPTGATSYKALANAYRSAYRSWVKRQAVKQAKARKATIDAITDAAGEIFAGGLTGKDDVLVKTPYGDRVARPISAVPKKPGVITNPAIRVVSVPVEVTQERVNKALGVLAALERGEFYINANRYSTNLGVSSYSFRQKRN